MADGTICRRFEDGHTEWRTRLPDDRVSWRDGTGGQGVDELLGDGVIKRVHAAGKVEYARDQGYGRTAWGNDTLTINRTALVGRLGGGLAAVGLGAAAAAIVAPPLSLSAAEEEELRRRKAGSSGGFDLEADGWGDDEEEKDEEGDFG